MAATSAARLSLAAFLIAATMGSSLALNAAWSALKDPASDPLLSISTFRSLSPWTIFFTTSMPATTLPKIEYAPFRFGVAAIVMKNCDPLVFGPALAMPTIPSASYLRSLAISFGNS